MARKTQPKSGTAKRKARKHSIASSFRGRTQIEVFMGEALDEVRDAELQAMASATTDIEKAWHQGAIDGLQFHRDIVKSSRKNAEKGRSPDSLQNEAETWVQAWQSRLDAEGRGSEGEARAMGALLANEWGLQLIDCVVQGESFPVWDSYTEQLIEKMREVRATKRPAVTKSA